MLKYSERKEYLKQYREKFKQLRVDLSIEDKNKLEEITKNKNITVAQYIRDIINKDYNKL